MSTLATPPVTHRLRDLRAYVDALASAGELVRVQKSVELDLELAAISRRCYDLGAPAPLFENIRGVERGFRVLGAPAGVSRQPGRYLSRVALSFGMDPSADGNAIVDALASARGRPGIPPRIVDDAPWKQNVLRGIDVDLGLLPAPLLHDGDGGRYLNTYGAIVARTPDGTWTNWSIARIMVVDKTHMSGIVAPNQHIGMIHKMWKDLGKPMPFALALGVEPIVPFVCGMPYPANMDEADLVGAYYGEGVLTTRCLTVPLEAPVSAEIVVEGYLSATETAREGPMGEYAGYMWGGEGSYQPVYDVTAIAHRDRAILPIVVAGEPVEEDHTAWGISNAAEIVYQLRSENFPVAAAWSPLESANHWFAITLKHGWRDASGKNARTMCNEIGESLFRTKAGMGTPKYIVLDDDVDPTNTLEVVWAFATRNYPGSAGEIVFGDESTNPLVAFLTTGDKMSFHTTKVVYNCLAPDAWQGRLPKRTSFTHGYSSDLTARILANWTAYGFDDAPTPRHGFLAGSS